MTTDAGRSLLRLLARLGEPLEQLHEAAGAIDTLTDLTDWDLTGTGVDPAPFVAMAGDLAAALAKLRQLDPDEPVAFEDILTILPDVMTGLGRFAGLGQQAQLAAGLPQDLGEQFIEDLFGCLVVLALGNFHPAIRSGLELFRVLSYAERPAIILTSGSTVRPARAYPKLDFNAVAQFFTSPGDFLLAKFGISDPAGLPAVQVAQRTFPYWAAFLRDLGVTAWASEIRAVPGSVPQAETEAERRSLFVLLPIDIGVADRASAGAVVCFSLFDVPGGGYELVLIPRGVLGVSREFGDWRVSLGATGQPGGLAIRRTGVDFKGDAAGLSVSAEIARPPGAPPLLRFGAASGIHVELGDLALSGTLKVAATSPHVTGGVRLAVKGLQLAVNAAPSDGFLKSSLPAQGFGGVCDLALQWSGDGGLKFEGKAGLEFALSLGKTIGPITIQELTIGLTASERGLELVGAVGIRLALGPLIATIDKIGLRLLLGPAAKGAVGPRLDIGFKPPRGVGFVVDANAVVGGGFLFFDVDAGQYGGILQLEVKGGISIKAIGLITTKMPDGSPGFSLLVIIAVEFSPIQLGYGFTLNGVGGLAGFNRTMKIAVLRDGIKNRTLDSIMFPPNPLANAQKIISDLQAVFPPAPGRFVFGPMVKLGWGAGMLQIEIGLIVELPSPLRLAIIGKLHVKLPPLQQGGDDAESKNIVELHLDVLGILDFDQSEASVDAVLYNSRLVLFPITGGMAMRLRWGSSPVFLLAIGGLNPRFPPPPAFPRVDRLGLNLSYEGSGLRAYLRLELYLAVTPNSLQFGARIDAYAEVAKAKVAGFLGFDALIEFNPFFFIVDLYGGVTVEAFGFNFNVDILLVLSGPKAFIGDGHATINFLGKHEVPIHFLIGDEGPIAALPLVNPLEELKSALGDLRNWSATLPNGGSMLVTFRQLSPKELKDKVLAHPLGELSVRQKVLPFGIALERFGAGKPTSPGPFEISEFRLGTAGTKITVESRFALRDAFARGQFVDLTEDEKLSSPVFEDFRCGQRSISTGALSYRKEAKQTATCEYDVVVIDNKEAQQKRSGGKSAIEEDAFLRAAQFGAAGRTPMKSMGSVRFAAPAQGIKVLRPKYALAGTEDMLIRGTDTFGSYTEAAAARGRGVTGAWQVVEAHEIA